VSEAGIRTREAFVQTIGLHEAGGELREVYRGLKARYTVRPKVYDTPTGDAPNIMKCHSLDPEGLRLAFSMSNAVHWGPDSLAWPTREMINTVSSRANNCFY
jgi:hypothetical protein